MAGAAVELEDVRFRYEDMDMTFDLAVPAGELTALIGPSGSGKTTILNLIAGFEAAVSGAIRIDGRDVGALPAAARPVTMVFQDHNVFAHLDVATNVGLGISPALRLRPTDRDRVAAALARVGLEDFGRRLPGQLSGGERQRVALARCLVRDRPVLLLDEPFAALGPALRREMLDLIADIHRERAMTVLLVTHQPEDARRIAARTAFVNDGRILAVRPTDELLGATDIPELREYLGEVWK
ncbi:MAG TPA: thiamine ABC transporter ATP-binding protein [Aestuariivirgaceae bacterium]|nr:thiamine ABC transporter ATP-binding protein [Aestuariivirgaceae bacterium]